MNGKDPLDYPLVSVTLRSMQQSMSIALHKEIDELKRIADQAIADALSEDTLRALAKEKAKKILEQKLEEEIKHWFASSDGSKIIMGEVKKQLDEMSKLY